MTERKNAEGLSIHSAAARAGAAEKIRRRLARKGLDALLRDLPEGRRASAARDGSGARENEARFIALACEETPDGVNHYYLRRPDERFFTLEGARVSRGTRGKPPGAARIKPWLTRRWPVPEDRCGFVAGMEAVLDLYQSPFDPLRPLICMAESLRRLAPEVGTPTVPGSPPRPGSEPWWGDSANIFMFTAPLGNWRRAEVRERRTARDWALEIRRLVDEDFPGAELITVVCDNLVIHHPASLYKTFPPRVASGIARRIEIVHTPAGGAWLNPAEIESCLMQGALRPDRISTVEGLRSGAAAWAELRNASGRGIVWHFTIEDARAALARFYPNVAT